VYYQGIDGIAAQNSNSYEIKIQPDDLLMIIVSAEDPEISMPFNLRSVSMVSPSRQLSAQSGNHAIVSGGRFWIHRIPCLGKLKVGGLSRSDVPNVTKK
jgi:polysaccharide export outer membrane protein